MSHTSTNDLTKMHNIIDEKLISKAKETFQQKKFNENPNRFSEG